MIYSEVRLKYTHVPTELRAKIEEIGTELATCAECAPHRLCGDHVNRLRYAVAIGTSDLKGFDRLIASAQAHSLIAYLREEVMGVWSGPVEEREQSV